MTASPDLDPDLDWQSVALDTRPPQPWKNGGGQTRELLCWPDPERWQLRLSVATIERAGPFSSFEGVQRWFAVLEGDGVVLTIDGAAVPLHRHSPPLSFAGDVPVHCEPVAGTTLDFNLMLRGVEAEPQSTLKGQPRGTLQRLPAGRQTIHCRTGEWHGFYCHAQAGQWACPGTQPPQRRSLPARTLLWQQAHRDSVIEIDAPQAFWIKVGPTETRR